MIFLYNLFMLIKTIIIILYCYHISNYVFRKLFLCLGGFNITIGLFNFLSIILGIITGNYLLTPTLPRVVLQIISLIGIYMFDKIIKPNINKN